MHQSPNADNTRGSATQFPSPLNSNRGRSFSPAPTATPRAVRASNQPAQNIMPSNLLVHGQDFRGSARAVPITPPRRLTPVTTSPHKSQNAPWSPTRKADDRLDADHCDVIRFCAAEVDQAIADLVVACAARGTDNRTAAAKISGFMAEDIARYRVLALHVASQPHPLTVPDGQSSVHPSYCVATKPRNDLASALWMNIKYLVSYIMISFLQDLRRLSGDIPRAVVRLCNTNFCGRPGTSWHRPSQSGPYAHRNG